METTRIRTCKDNIRGWIGPSLSILLCIVDDSYRWAAVTNTVVYEYTLLLQTPPLQWSPIDFRRLRCTVMTTMSALSFHDLLCFPLRQIKSSVPCSMDFDSVSCPQTWPNHDNLRRFTVDYERSWRPAWIMTCCHICSFVLCSLCDMPSSLM